MQRLLIFSIFIGFAAAKDLQSESDFVKLEASEKLILKECAREYNLDEGKYSGPIDLDEYEKNPDKDTACMVACSTRKSMVKIVTGSNNKETLYNGFKKLIDEAYEKGFEKENAGFSREDVVEKVEQCYASSKNECDFIVCSDFYDGQLFKLFIHSNTQPGGSSVFDSVL